MKPCCQHPVERHAYNGCAECGCAVRWSEHPKRGEDTSDAAAAEALAWVMRHEATVTYTENAVVVVHGTRRGAGATLVAAVVDLRSKSHG